MNTDNKILKLKNDIEEKKNALSGSDRFAPVTNCSLELDGTRYNLHVTHIDTMIYLLCKLSAYQTEANKLELELNLSGFQVTDWITDLKAKIAFVNRSSELKKLKAMESRLNDLLSDKKKAELEVEEIGKLLNA